MKPFLVQSDLKFSDVKRLRRWEKKYAKFGAYMEVEEYKVNKFSVKMYCPKIYVDFFGNMAAVKGTRL